MAKTNDETPQVQLPAMTFEQLKELMTSLMQSPSSEGAAAFKALEKMAEAQVMATKTLGDEVKRTVMRSNADHEHISVFEFKRGCEFCDTKKRHPEDPDVVGSGRMGHPKPALRYETFFPKNAKVIVDDATVLEVELFNQLGDRLQNLKAPLTARQESWTAEMSKNGRRLQVDAPCFTADERGSLPPLPQILLELLHGESANPEAALEEVIALRERIAALEHRVLTPA